MGVDRFTQYITGEAVASMLGLVDPFGKADDLWQSFQQGIENYVDSHSGNATIVPYTFERPDWSDVEDILEGEKSVKDLDDC